MHPRSRLCMLVCQDVRDLSFWIRGNAFARCTGEAVSNGVMEKIVGVEVNAGSSM